MIRTDLVPHPYFNVKSPEFYKKQKAQFELSKSKFKLVNSIRSGQEQELLQRQVEEVKRKQKALNELTKLQETLEFQLDDQNPRVYSDKTPAGRPVGRPAEAPVEAPVKARPVMVEEPMKLDDMNLSKLRTNFRDEFGDFLTGKSAWVNKLSVDNLRSETRKLRNLPEGERGEYIAELKKASKSSSNVPEAHPSFRRPVPISAEEFKKGKSGLKKGVERKQKPKPATKKPLSLMEQIQQSAPFLERARSMEEETEGFGLKTKKKTRGKGISKKQKKVLLYGSAVAGNNNSKLLDTIMKI
jgi:hypothetical protein